MNQHERTMRIMDKLLEEMDLAIIKAKAQIEYMDDTVSGDLVRDE